MINTSNFNWKGNRLFLSRKDTKFGIKPCEVKDAPISFYQIKYPDGSLSESYFNLTWAKDNCLTEATRHLNAGVLVPASLAGETLSTHGYLDT